MRKGVQKDEGVSDRLPFRLLTPFRLRHVDDIFATVCLQAVLGRGIAFDGDWRPRIWDGIGF